MPILPKQRDIYPDGLLDGGEDDPAGKTRTVDGAHWIAFYTLARREKELMRQLESISLPFYSPLIRRRLHTAGGRVRYSYVPLFPGYVFAPVDDDQRREVLATNTVARWLLVSDERMLVHDLRSIKRLIDSERPLTPEARLQPGHEVRVTSGPLRGVEGTVIRRRGTERLIVAVRLLNQGVSMELEDIDLERI